MSQASTLEEANSLRRQLAHLEVKKHELLAQLQHIEQSCTHRWSEPTRGFQKEDVLVESREGGRMQGVDFIPAIKVTERRTPMWSRTCQRCGKTEVTYKTTVATTTTQKPVFD